MRNDITIKSEEVTLFEVVTQEENATADLSHGRAAEELADAPLLHKPKRSYGAVIRNRHLLGNRPRTQMRCMSSGTFLGR